MKWIMDKVHVNYINQLILMYNIDVNVYYSAHFGQGNGPIWLSYLYCTGTEQNILNCQRGYGLGNSYYCSHVNDVSVVCPGNISFVTQFVIYFM